MRGLWGKFRALSTRVQVVSWIVLAFVVIVIIGVASGGSSSSKSKSSSATATTPANASPVLSTPTTPVKPVSAAATADQGLQNYIDGLNQKMAQCEAGISDTQVALAQALSSSASASSYVTVYTAAKQAAPSCSYSATTFGTYNPPSGYPSLAGAAYGGFGLQVEHWAQNDSGKVLSDVQAVANDPLSTAAVGNVLTDSQQADSDAGVIEAQLRAAAVRGHIKNFAGLGLPIWGLHQKS